jgi:phosphoribosyl 1,2-cyclic phosphodiesterase
MQVTLWGTRGSVPSPGPNTVRYGGNTSCVEIRLDDGTEIILDAGTGIRALGRKLAGQEARPPIFLLMSHAHWDHVHGFPFFRPAYESGWRVHVGGWSHSIQAIRDLMYQQMDGLSFPVEFGELGADVSFMDLGDSASQIQSATLELGLCSHPGGCSCFRVRTDGSGTLMHITDNELAAVGSDARTRRRALTELCSGVDVLIHDAQFLPEELARFSGWGHSSYEDAVELAAQAGAKRLLLFHHDPDRTDKQVDEIALRAQEHIARRGYKLKCEPAREGMSFTL